MSLLDFIPANARHKGVIILFMLAIAISSFYAGCQVKAVFGAGDLISSSELISRGE